jgi:hypothetical protein
MIALIAALESTTNDNQTVIIAFFGLITALAVVVGPIITTSILGRQKAAEIAHREEREDKVARRVEKVATDAAAANKATTSTLKQIHTLVNSDMTAARTAELMTTRLLIVALRRQSGGDDEETTAAIVAAQNRVIELEQILADRLVAQRKVEADAAAELAAAIPVQ